ncbi:hypothetical protein NDU88_004344 [Pleurodeles waltl]|uniref:Uncharacterized protein n=1 Tax=Pleurodeles waltl TaxID=8319 RepID=A0AAV7NMF0_PLEWA|nr:hypothetical protein NDU88_004344 [Pleurodeles waltl]
MRLCAVGKDCLENPWRTQASQAKEFLRYSPTTREQPVLTLKKQASQEQRVWKSPPGAVYRPKYRQHVSALLLNKGEDLFFFVKKVSPQ